MKIFRQTIILSLITMMAFSLHIRHQNQLNMTGGWSTGTLDQVNKDIDTFIKKQIPELANAKLTKVQTQIVAGINYGYTYALANQEFKVIVWDQQWTGLREVIGIQKVERSTNAAGQRVQVTTTTWIERRTFNQVAKDYFPPSTSPTPN